MRALIATLFAAMALPAAAQLPPGLGDDPATFDQQIDSAFARRDAGFIDAVVAEDVRFNDVASPAAKAWDKPQLLDAVRHSTALTRAVDGVQVEAHGDLVETSGDLRITPADPARPAYQIAFVRLYRRGPRGWQLVSHRAVRQSGAPPAPPQPTGAAAEPQPTPPGVVRPGNGVTLPRLLHEVKPQYTSEAMQKRIQGMVLLECVVNADGSVSHVKVLRSLDALYGLDEQAIRAAQQWRFAPGTRNGQPVPVMISLEMTFTLGK
jgi:TonB family protein